MQVFLLRRLVLSLFSAVWLLPALSHAVTFGVDKTTYASSDNITATWTRVSGDTQAAKDWIGIYTPTQVPSGSSPSLRWFYLNGTKTAPGAAVQSGSITFTNPGLAAGNYVARFLSNDGYTELAPAVSFTVLPAPPTFSLNKSSYLAGENITATFGRATGNTMMVKDWIAIYRSNQTPGTDYSLTWRYLNGSTTAPAAVVQNGSVTFSSPTLPAGSYVARFFANDGYTDIAPGIPFTITAGGGPAVPQWVVNNFPLRYALTGTAYTGCVRGYAKDTDTSDTLTFAKVSGPTWLTIAADGTLGGTPAVGDVGTNTFTVKATDIPGNNATATFTVQVFAPGTAHIDKLKVLSYNLFHGWGKVTNGVRKGIDSILLSGADVVCTVESTDNVTGSNQFQPQAVAAEIGWFYTRIPGGGDVGVISRYPITDTYSASVAVGARITMCANPLQEVIVYSTHLDYLHYGPYEAARSGSTNATTMTEELASNRDEQATALVAAMQSQLGAADQTPVVVCGDFNCPSHQDWTAAAASQHYGKTIAWPATLSLTNAGLVDTFRQMHPNPVTDPGNTWAPIYTGDEPQDRIDFVFAKGNRLTTLSSSVYHTAVENTFNNYYSDITAIAGNTWPSDHAAVLTEFSVKQVDADGNGLPDYWENQRFGGAPPQGLNGDDDGNGISNILDYASGMPAGFADASRLCRTRRESDGLRVSYLRRKGGTGTGCDYLAGGMRYRLLRSIDLTNWVPADDWCSDDAPSSAGGDGEEMSVKVTPPPGSQQQFFRLSVAPN
ncbi:endonuclease/exonuclease/phosphatase family protein [Luteolibacter ambystomatis]|uniref:Endonuclease/exonuclease/phosphatase family protein n=1 Tax=Luteolibacter ambystomatis TaxID=2824561 RepID=A0A975J1R2_9BACT|nr:endonuclease/exonuclease/phosphatase family protein [Luteolibacter ambystomatis]QUE52430.1 endonuclease/exonuclease/phosphatase family protein [Luteolibacter ambystomatis]